MVKKWLLKKKLFQESVFNLPDDIVSKLDDLNVSIVMLEDLLKDLNKQLGIEKVSKLIEDGKILDIIKDLIQEGYSGYPFILELKKRILLL